MKSLSLFAAAFASASLIAQPAPAASFSCEDLDYMNAAERRICTHPGLSALDERLDSWYRRALVRARHFDQTTEVRGKQRAWLASRNGCGGGVSCLRRHYLTRIRQLRNYVEHV